MRPRPIWYRGSHFSYRHHHYHYHRHRQHPYTVISIAAVASSLTPCIFIAHAKLARAARDAKETRIIRVRERERMGGEGGVACLVARYVLWSRTRPAAHILFVSYPLWETNPHVIKMPERGQSLFNECCDYLLIEITSSTRFVTFAREHPITFLSNNR